MARRIHSEDVAALPAPERLVYLRREIDGPIVFTRGFGIEGQLIFHWICERDLDIDVVTRDTGRLFPETYTLWAERERRYGRRIRAVYPDCPALERLVAKQGIDGIYESKQARTACCDVRKTRPLDRALSGAVAWITGLRADQSENRRDGGLSAFDASRGVSSTRSMIGRARRYCPRRAGSTFPSIACTPRASPRSAARRARGRCAPERNGRWWWEQDGHKECGLHLPRNRPAKDSPRRDPVEISAGCG